MSARPPSARSASSLCQWSSTNTKTAPLRRCSSAPSTDRSVAAFRSRAAARLRPLTPPGSAMEQVIVNGLYLGAQYALIALGLTLIFALMNVLNFAHGQMYVFGGFITYTVYGQLHLPFVVALACSGVTLAIIGALFERFLFRTVIRRSLRDESTMLLAAGTAFFLDAVILLLFGEKQRGVPKIVNGVLNVDWLIMPYDKIAVGVIALVLIASFMAY